MTSGLRVQGQFFCAISLALVVASLAGLRANAGDELLAVGALVLLLGVPHGSLDVVVARRLWNLSGTGAWVVFAVRYLGLAVLVVGLWWVAPTLFLGAFLGFSALHFGADPAAGVSWPTRVLYGGTVVVLPALRHGAELQQLMGLVAGPASAAVVVPTLCLLAAPWLGAIGLACAWEVRTSWLAAAELAALAAVSVTAPPLVAFTLYFCAMHSPRHILRTISARQGIDVRHALAMALWPTLAVFAMAVLAGLLASAIPLEKRLLQLLFVGLAALTLPHMVLLERARRARPTAIPEPCSAQPSQSP